MRARHLRNAVNEARLVLVDGFVEQFRRVGYDIAHMPDHCSLLLTQGTYSIDEMTAKAVEKALDEGRPSVDVAMDLSGSGNIVSRARIAMLHVVAVIRQPALAIEDNPFAMEAPNLYVLPVRR